MITDFSTREASAIAEVFIPWTGAECAVLRVISKTATAANEAITHRPSGMTICFSIDPLKKTYSITLGMRRSPTNGANPGKGRSYRRRLYGRRPSRGSLDRRATGQRGSRDDFTARTRRVHDGKPQPGFVSGRGESVPVRKRQPVESGEL